MSVERVPVALGGRSYEILVGAGLLGEAGALMRPLLKTPRTIVVTDANVAALHLPALLRGLDLRIGIDEGQLQPRRQPPADIGLAGAHQADQHEAAWRHTGRTHGGRAGSILAAGL